MIAEGTTGDNKTTPFDKDKSFLVFIIYDALKRKLEYVVHHNVAAIIISHIKSEFVRKQELEAIRMSISVLILPLYSEVLIARFFTNELFPSSFRGIIAA